MPRRKRSKPSPSLSRLLKRLGISYKDAELVLIVAEMDSFPEPMHPDPITQTNLIEFPEWFDDQHVGNETLAYKLARSADPLVRSSVDRILAANPQDIQPRTKKPADGRVDSTAFSG